MGGKPNKGTKRDKRLKENKPKPRRRGLVARLGRYAKG